MKKLLAITSIALLTSTTYAAEATIDYNEISAGYSSMEMNSNTYTGYGVSASYLLTENFFVIGSYGSLEKSPTTIASTSASVGYRMPIAVNTDAVATIGYGYTTITSQPHQDSYPMTLGIRSSLTPDIDVGANLVYVEATDAQSGFSASVKYKLSNNLFIRGDYRNLTDSTMYSIGVGMKF